MAERSIIPEIHWEKTSQEFLVKYGHVFFALTEDRMRKLALALFDALEEKRNAEG